MGIGLQTHKGSSRRARLRVVQVIVASPIFDDLPGITVAGEQILIEAFVAQASVEALDETVLHWLTRRDVMPLYSMVLLPFEGGVRGQLCAVAHWEGCSAVADGARSPA